MTAKHKATKKDIVAQCRDVFRAAPEFYRGDYVAQREYFNDYTDYLCKSGVITERQYETWTNPF